MTKQKAIICDLDGTLINCDHRHHFVEGDKKDWKNFLHPDNIKQDTKNFWCSTIISCLSGGGISIIYITGRNEEIRDLTQKQINIPPEHLNLFMRKNDDYREDYIVKEEIYKEHIEPFYDVLFCIDDRKQVVDMWRRLGLVCLQCAEGDF